ncbi:MAG: tRNA (guanosine(46)-N7)-methyltransferase TrmB [Clostridia bacterium]|nr:tRNA (guanosine(46)-N7)-methyltransferase TrmB [Clostridia bacterium]
MRMRPKKNRDKRMDAVKKWFIPQDENGVVNLDGVYPVDGELFLEIGCGKGAFIMGLSKQFPNNKLLAVELVPDVLMMAMEKAERENTQNVRFLHANADTIADILPEGSVSRLYLNFSDPWPKKRNAKRRLTSPLFLEKYKKILADDGKIIFKTDNKGLFDYSLESFTENGFTVSEVTFDLHSDPVFSVDNIKTEYEINFSAKGFLINRLVAQVQK